MRAALIAYLVTAVAIASVTGVSFWYAQLADKKTPLRNLVFSVGAGVMWPVIAVGALWAAGHLLIERRGK